MKAKYLILAVLAIANFPIYRALFRVLFRGMARKTGRNTDPADAVAGGSAEGADTGSAGPEESAPGEARDDGARRRGSLPRLGDFRDPEFLHDGGGEYKLFLLVLASVLVVLIEYYSLLSAFPALREALLLGRS